jgi:L-fuculose-phosphate aldolase
MLFEKERNELVETGKKMISSGLVKGTGGNLSVYFPKEQIMAITPGSMDYFSIKAEDIVLMNIDEKIIEGRQKPSSEWRMHMIFYKKRKEARAVVHTHSSAAAAVSCLRRDLPPIYYLTMMAGEDIKCSKYYRFGTEDLAEEAYKTMEGRSAALLANHGVITCSYSLARAYHIAEQVEYTADLFLKCESVGKPVQLTKDNVQEMIDVFEGAKAKALKNMEGGIYS